MSNFSDAVRLSFNNVIAIIISYLPNILGGLLLLLIGVIISIVIANLVRVLLHRIRLERAVEHVGAPNLLKKIHRNLTLTEMIAGLVKWLLILVTVIAAAQVMGFAQITDFLNKVILYIPNIIAAVIILVAGVALARFLEEIITRALANLNMRSSEIAGSLIKWLVIIFSFMIALVQLGIAPALITILLVGLVSMLAIAGGISFGLGGTELAKELLTRLRNNMQGRGGAGGNIGTGP